MFVFWTVQSHHPTHFESWVTSQTFLSHGMQKFRVEQLQRTTWQCHQFNAKVNFRSQSHRMGICANSWEKTPSNNTVKIWRHFKQAGIRCHPPVRISECNCLLSPLNTHFVHTYCCESILYHELKKSLTAVAVVNSSRDHRSIALNWCLSQVELSEYITLNGAHKLYVFLGNISCTSFYYFTYYT